MDLLKSTTSKVATGAITLAVVAGAITWWQTPVETRDAILAATGRIIGWLLLVVVAPFPFSPLLASVAKKFNTNAGPALLIIGVTLVEAVLLAWLLNFSISGAAGWIFYLLALAFAGAYNLLICDWLAERLA